MGCTNAAQAFAAMPSQDKLVLHQERQPNLGIVAAYNDMLLDCDNAVMELHVDEAEWASRPRPAIDLDANEYGHGRELSGLFRRNAGRAENGASALLGND